MKFNKKLCNGAAGRASPACTRPWVQGGGKNICLHECEERLLMRVRIQHRMLSLAVNSRHLVCMAHSLNCTVTHQFDSSIMTRFTDKETEVERVLSNLTRHS